MSMSQGTDPGNTGRQQSTSPAKGGSKNSFIEVRPPVSSEIRVSIDPLTAQQLRQSGRWMEFMGALGEAVALESSGFQLNNPPHLGFEVSFGGRDCVVALVEQEGAQSFSKELIAKSIDLSRAKALIENLTEKDLQSLDALFRSKLFTEDSFGYVLMFEKPAAMITPSRLIDKPGINYDLKYEGQLREGVEVWNRIFADSSDFYFRSTSHLAKFQGGVSLPNRFFISKSKTTAVIEENLDVFQRLLKTSDSADRIFERMMASNADFDKVIKDDRSLGLLLGFGRANVEGYLEFEEAFWGDGEVTQAELLGRRFMLHDERVEKDPSVAQLHQAAKGVGQIEYAVFTGKEDALRLKLKYTKQRLALKGLLESEDFLERVVERVLSYPYSTS